MVNVVGTIKDVLLTYAGFAFFDDSNCSQLVLLGLAVSFAGAGFSLKSKLKLVK